MGLAKSLVVIQVALALLLSIGAGLLVRTLKELEGQSLGFDQEHLLLFGVHPELNGYAGERVMDFYVRLRARLQALPSVKSVSMSFLPPLSGWANQPPISVEGYESGRWKSLNSDWDNVGPSFFETMGIPVMLGRGIESRDRAGSTKVAVVNEAFAREAFGGRNAIGHRVRFGFSWESNPEYEIVGVVKNARLVSLRRVAVPAVYTPYAQMPKLLGLLNFELRTEGDPLALVPTVRRAVHDIDPDIPISDVRTQTQQIAETLTQERLLDRLFSFFGGLALLLACVGLYGLMAYAVTQRTREIGIRMALGSQRRDALRLVLGQGLKLTLIGVMIGVAGALASTRFLASLLYGVKPTDPLTFIAVSLILSSVATLACYIPARRAMKVDPMVALRYE
jgi:predicted permease